MLAGRYVAPKEHVGGPREIGRILCAAEDETILRISGAAMVEDAGFEAVEANNADEALQILEARDDISLLFTDIDMPQGSLNGLKLAATTRDRWPAIAIIVVSGKQIPKGSDLPPGSAFYGKPYPEEEVLDRMRAMLRAA